MLSTIHIVCIFDLTTVFLQTDVVRHTTLNTLKNLTKYLKMADNTDKEQLDDLPNPQPENSSDETIPTKEAEAISPNQETENMEVHHHAHHGGNKSWKSYFWQFLMLFLAVFCGFLAEYQLEHVIEHNKEKQYIASMVKDLETDSISIVNSINGNKRLVSALDSLLQNIYHTPYTDSSIKTLYYLKKTYSGLNSTVLFSRGTISQLKNSGGLRLIRNRAVSDSIINYDIITERIDDQGESVELSTGKLFDLSVKIFDDEYFFDYNRSNYREILNSNKKLQLLSNDKKLIKEYANLAQLKRNVIRNYITLLTRLQSRVPVIMQFLKKEYHLN